MGTANIARKNWKSIWNADNANLVAVASRDAARANQFVEGCQSQVPFASRPRCESDYEALLATDDIDAIYLPLPTAVRKEWVIRAAEAGKHVLVEKPCGVNAAEVQEIVDVCAKNNVQFMDGVMFMHSDRLTSIGHCIANEKRLGNLKRIASQFSFCAEEEFMQSNIRVQRQLEPLGCLGDLGWYNIRFTLWAMDWQMPDVVTGRMLREREGGIPLEFSGEMIFPNGVSASMYCAFVNHDQQWVNLSGTEGHLQIDDFVLPFYASEIGYKVTKPCFDAETCDFNMNQRTQNYWVEEYSNSFPNSQEAKMFRNFSANVLSGNIDHHWSEIALKTQIVLDRMLEASRR